MNNRKIMQKAFKSLKSLKRKFKKRYSKEDYLNFLWVALFIFFVIIVFVN